MKRKLWYGWLLLCAVAAVAQTNQIYLEQRADGWWATWSNTPPRFTIYFSSNMVDWTVWMKKDGTDKLKSIEMKLASSNDFRFLKFEPTAPPPPPPQLKSLLEGLTNSTPNKVKTK